LTFINTAKQITSQANASVSTSTDMSNVEFNKIYQMLPVIKNLPVQILASARETADKTPESMLVQTGTVMVKGFYKELGMDIGKIQNSYILKIGLFMLLIALISGCATISVAFLSSKIAAGLSKNLRRSLFEKVESFSNNEFDKFSTDSLITRT
jgi:ATP-binding cassette subfamily B protein